MLLWVAVLQIMQKKVAESFSNVASVTVNNLEKDRFELTLSISGDSEIRPTLVKKLVEGGFDLYEMSTTQSKDDVSTKNTEASKNPEPRKKTEPTKKVDSTAAKDTVKKSAPKIGDKGPAGGIVFYIEGKKAYECSEPLGNAEWEEAITLCKKYRGGGKSDWYLPTKEELNYIYKNLREPEIINDDERLWSSLEDDDKTLAWAQGFSTKGSGRGVGMYHTKQLVESLGGTISFESEKDIGTSFMVQLKGNYV